MSKPNSTTTTSTHTGNNHSVVDAVGIIDLGRGHTALVDADMLLSLLQYQWRAVKANRCWYAKTTVGKPGNTCDLSMHRLIAKTPHGKICHHRNRNSLDNRKANLLNLSRYDHELLHRNNSLLIKFDENYR